MNPNARAYGRLLGSYLRPYWRSAALLLCIVLVTIGFELVNPQLLRLFIDDAHQGSGLGSLIPIAATFLVIAAVTQVTSVVEAYVAENLGWKVTNGIRNDLALHVLRLDPPFHNSHSPGEMIERVDGDVTNLANFFARFVVYVFGNAVLLAAVVGLLFAVDWRVGAAMGVFTIVSAFVLLRTQNLSVPHWKESRQASAELYGLIEERLAGAEDIRANGLVDYSMRLLFERSRRLIRTVRKAQVLSSTSYGAASFMLSAAGAIALGFGGYLVTHHEATIGTAYLIFSYSQLLNGPVQELMRQLQDLQQASASLVRVQELFGMHSVIVDGSEAAPAAGAVGVTFENVTFAYEEGEPALRDVSFEAQAGSVLGIIGRTGSGKTTISRLLFRLYDPGIGRVTMGGRDLRSLCVSEVRARIGMVTQDIQLFYGSVRENLTFFDRSVSEDRIETVLEDLGLSAWRHSLPDGLETLITAGATGISAGEAQLLAFARVFLTDPSVVILDEASSRLDPATERRVEHATEALLRDRTGVIIAHRLETLDRCDSILVLEDGRVREFGGREELMADHGSRYAELLAVGRTVAAP